MEGSIMITEWSLVVSFILGSAVAGVIVWAKTQKKQQKETLLITELKTRLNASNEEILSLKQREGYLQKELTDNKERANENESQLREQLSELRTKLDYEKEKSKEMTNLHKTVTDQFENIANKILEEKSEKFTIKNKENLHVILTPFNEKLGEFKKKVEDTYRTESNERASLKGEIKQLLELNQTMASEAKQLTSALKGESKVQGNWGEIILERILEKSGLQKGIEFSTQEAFQSQEGRRQHPDVILNLPEGKHIIIDSKVSLAAYERCFSTEEENEKEKAVDDHIKSIRTHIKQLSEKKYQQLYPINSPDFVLMFMPIEPAFGVAVKKDPTLFMHALDQNVLLVSPSTLLTTLQIIANIWKQDKQDKNAREIARKGGELYDKFVAILEDLQKLEKQFNTARGTYDTVIKKLSSGRGNLIQKVEEIKHLGAKTSKSLPAEFRENDDTKATIDTLDKEPPSNQTQRLLSE